MASAPVHQDHYRFNFAQATTGTGIANKKVGVDQSDNSSVDSEHDDNAGEEEADASALSGADQDWNLAGLSPNVFGSFEDGLGLHGLEEPVLDCRMLEPHLRAEFVALERQQSDGYTGANFDGDFGDFMMGPHLNPINDSAPSKEFRLEDMIHTGALYDDDTGDDELQGQEDRAPLEPFPLHGEVQEFLPHLIDAPFTGYIHDSDLGECESDDGTPGAPMVAEANLAGGNTTEDEDEVDRWARCGDLVKGEAQPTGVDSKLARPKSVQRRSAVVEPARMSFEAGVSRGIVSSQYGDDFIALKPPSSPSNEQASFWHQQCGSNSCVASPNSRVTYAIVTPSRDFRDRPFTAQSTLSTSFDSHPAAFGIVSSRRASDPCRGGLFGSPQPGMAASPSPLPFTDTLMQILDVPSTECADDHADDVEGSMAHLVNRPDLLLAFSRNQHRVTQRSSMPSSPIGANSRRRRTRRPKRS
ncbi:hypothetical protein K470DRAFT_261846 [Piedraia hortae CBS 480.64]|uniref:Uncharacterized protein n=1 Tax=Piedraia hortae CBS 480.64 TaxID=1314780 RepID=A0A6A7C8X3_9PEZI|nr:hypothetical protein K470DRAFT_261846 [Piedraia hortae CBS 480.64]